MNRSDFDFTTEKRRWRGKSPPHVSTVADAWVNYLVSWEGRMLAIQLSDWAEVNQVCNSSI